MLRIAICDDNSDFLDQANNLIKKWFEQNNIPVEIYRFDNGDALIEKSATVQIDIIFLDIIMPFLNGMDTAKELRQTNRNVKIIFLTSSPEFALESYTVKAYDYLLKPITYEKIKAVLDECSHGFDTEPKNIVFKTAFGYQKLFYYDIEYAEAQSKKVTFYLRDGNTIDAIEPFYSFVKRLTNCDGFFKCHRSYLVYLHNVDHFNMTEIITKSGRRIPIARGYGKPFQEAYFSRIFGD